MWTETQFLPHSYACAHTNITEINLTDKIIKGRGTAYTTEPPPPPGVSPNINDSTH